MDKERMMIMKVCCECGEPATTEDNWFGQTFCDSCDRDNERAADNPPENEYPVKTIMRWQGIYSTGDSAEEQANFYGGLVLMEMLMEGKCTMFTREGDRLDAEEAARTAADAWDTDPDKLIAKALEWEPLLKLRREDPDGYRREMEKRNREWVEADTE